MEYLEMHGTVQLKSSVNPAIVDSLVKKLIGNEFCDDGFVSIEWEGNLLSLNAEGMISESHSFLALLKQLQRHPSLEKF